MTRKISGTILAGGAGKRFNGLVKTKIVVDGETIISRILSVTADLFDEIIIVTNNPEEYKDLTFCTIVSDEIPGAGPLGGIHAAMKASSNDAVFVFAGDMPFLDSEIIIRLIETYALSDCEVLIPEIGDFIEPLHSVYDISLADNLEAYLRGQKSKAVRDFIKTLNVQYLQFEGSEKNKRAFTNINSPADIFPEQV
jgi:molybdopterin-guanine dinucleotide biosynthesis protein A